MQGGAAIVRFWTVESAQRMLSENHGRRVVDNIMSIHFAHMTTFLVGLTPMENDDTAGVSTISTMEGLLPPPPMAGTVARAQSNAAKVRTATQGQAGSSPRLQEPVDGMRAAINAVQSLCSSSCLQLFANRVADGALITTLLLLATAGRPGPTNAP